MTSLLKFKKSNLVNQLLVPLSKFTEKAKIQFSNGKLSALAHTSSADVIFYASTRTSPEHNFSLNLPNIQKFVRAVNCIDSDEIELEFNGNKLEYSKPGLRFKYHLLDDAVMARCAVTAEKIDAFQYDTSFTVSSQKISEALKNSSFASETEKVYFFQNGKDIMLELGDREIANTDNIVFNISNDGNETTPLLKAYPIKIETLRYFAGLKFEKVNVRVNNARRILCFEINEDVNIKYIVSALVK